MDVFIDGMVPFVPEVISTRLSLSLANLREKRERICVGLLARRSTARTRHSKFVRITPWMIEGSDADRVRVSVHVDTKYLRRKLLFDLLV